MGRVRGPGGFCPVATWQNRAGRLPGGQSSPSPVEPGLSPAGSLPAQEAGGSVSLSETPFPRQHCPFSPTPAVASLSDPHM